MAKKKRNKQNVNTVSQSESKNVVINHIEIKPVNRQILDVGKWRTALISADNGRRTMLFNMYEDILTDGVLGDAIDKRIRAVTGADLTFQFADGSESDEMIKLIDTDEFEYMLQEIVKAKFWHMSVIEPTFDNEGMKVYSVPRKHIRPETKTIAKLENDPEGQFSYEGLDVIEVISREHKHGLLLRACPYAIMKRGGIGDWAQMVELFGMPLRVGKYSVHDPEARKSLQEAFSSQGGAATLIVPKETDIETTTQSGNGGGSLYKDFIEAMDEQLLITILSQTMTTKDGASKSQGQVHKEVEEAVNKSDLRFVQRALNQKLKPILEKRGYAVKDGSFVFPKAIENLTVSDLISLSSIIEIPAYYFQERFSIPSAEEDDIIARRNNVEKIEVEKETKQKDSKKLSDKPKGLRSFFANAPTIKERGIITALIDNITGTITLKDSDAGKYSINLNKLLQDALNEIYNNEINKTEQPLVSKPLFDISNDALQFGLKVVFNEKDFYKKNQAFVDEFKHNTAVFASFKNHQQTKKIVELLHDDDGKLRSFSEFKKLVAKVSEDYNVKWLQTEYNTAVRSARSATNFKKYLETKHLYPNLEYIESSSKNKREVHLDYVGTVLPIEHEWWDTHMPPSDWNCACSVKQTDKEVTPVPDSELVSKLFQNNPAKTAEFINIKETDYYKSTDKKLINKVIESTTELTKKGKDKK